MTQTNDQRSPNLPPIHSLTMPGFAGGGGDRGGVGLEGMKKEDKKEGKRKKEMRKLLVEVEGKIDRGLAENVGGARTEKMPMWVWAEYKWLARQIEKKLETMRPQPGRKGGAIDYGLETR